MIPFTHLNGETVEKTNHQIHPDCFMISEESYFRKVWSGMLIVLLLYTATVMPFNIALYDDDVNMLAPTKLMDTMVDFLFMIDIYVNFNTGIVVPELAIDYNRKNVSINYLKGWCIIDILASIPLNFILDLITHNDDTDNNNINVSG
jgi:hypothetical protein